MVFRGETVIAAPPRLMATPSIAKLFEYSKDAHYAVLRLEGAERDAGNNRGADELHTIAANLLKHVENYTPPPKKAKAEKPVGHGAPIIEGTKVNAGKAPAAASASASAAPATAEAAEKEVPTPAAPRATRHSGAEPMAVGEAEAAAAPAQVYAVGQKVRSKWVPRAGTEGPGEPASGDRKWFDAEVTAVNADGTYALKFEDGDRVDDAPHQFMSRPKRPRDEGAGSSGEAGPSASAAAPAPEPAEPPPKVAAPARAAPPPAPAPAPTGGGRRLSLDDVCSLWHRQGHVKQDSKKQWSHLRKKLRVASEAGRVAPHEKHAEWWWGAGDRPLAEIPAVFQVLTGQQMPLAADPR